MCVTYTCSCKVSFYCNLIRTDLAAELAIYKINILQNLHIVTYLVSVLYKPDSSSYNIPNYSN